MDGHLGATKQWAKKRRQVSESGRDDGWAGGIGPHGTPLDLYRVRWGSHGARGVKTP